MIFKYVFVAALAIISSAQIEGQYAEPTDTGMTSSSGGSISQAIQTGNAHLLSNLVSNARPAMAKRLVNHMMSAIGTGSPDLVQPFLDSPYIDPSANGNIALKTAIYNGAADVASLLLQNDKVARKTSREQLTSWVSKSDDPAAVEGLIEEFQPRGGFRSALTSFKYKAKAAPGKTATAVGNGFSFMGRKSKEAAAATAEAARNGWEATTDATRRGWEATTGAATRGWEATTDATKRGWDATTGAATRGYEATSRAARNARDSTLNGIDGASAKYYNWQAERNDKSAASLAAAAEARRMKAAGLQERLNMRRGAPSAAPAEEGTEAQAEEPMGEPALPEEAPVRRSPTKLSAFSFEGEPSEMDL